MTQHLLPLEAGARWLCASKGVNPDAVVAAPHALFPGVVEQVPYWHQEAEALLELSKMMAALRIASAAQQPAAVEDKQLPLFPH